MSLIYHITGREAWEKAQAEGAYRVESLETEGFIHASVPVQILWVANKFYVGLHDLVLLEIETDKVAAEVRFEPPSPPSPDARPLPAGGELFPHIYGALNTDAVVKVYEFPLYEDGLFRVPDGVG